MLNLALLPHDAQRRQQSEAAATAAGATIVPVGEATALSWLDEADPATLAAVLDDNPQITWVQLPWAGVEEFAASGVFNRPIRFTCAKGAYGEQVGEHALFMTLAVLRNAREQLAKTTWTPTEISSLFRKRVTIIGGGGIAEQLVALLQPFDCAITVLRRCAITLEGAETKNIAELPTELLRTDVLVIAAPLTTETSGLIDAHALSLLPAGAIVINVGRGGIIDTSALVDALRSGHIAGAGLDVTDPEPLPDGHPLWLMNNVVITSHSADSLEFVSERLAKRLADNVERIQRGDELLGLISAEAGY